MHSAPNKGGTVPNLPAREIEGKRDAGESRAARENFLMPHTVLLRYVEDVMKKGICPRTLGKSVLQGNLRVNRTACT